MAYGQRRYEYKIGKLIGTTLKLISVFRFYNHPMSKNVKIPCPCGGLSYETCCGPLHRNEQFAQSPEQLMRSRYSAFANRLENYLRETWHPSTRPSEQILTETNLQKWIHLSIQNTSTHGSTGIVEFIATYRLSGRAHHLHEISNFLNEGGRWYYVDGSFPNETS